MFRRHWHGLPKDALFASDLKGLGYFVNDDDEIRSIENPDYYFKYFLNKNLRVNERQRFEFDRAIETVVHERLENKGLEKVALPLGTPITEPHSPIFATPNLETKARIVVVFGEPTQNLGMLAGRVASGRGGVDKGTMVSVVRALKEQASTPDDTAAPGIVLANMGQRYWWPDRKRPLTWTDSSAIPLQSSVHLGRKYAPELNDIPHSRTPMEHVELIFGELLMAKASKTATIDIIAIGQSCETVSQFFDDDKNWNKYAGERRVSSMALLGSVYTTDHLKNEAFKEFLVQRTRGYLLSDEPLDAPIAAPTGNPSLCINAMGYPCYSSSESMHTELILIKAMAPVLGFLQEAALNPARVNPPIVVVERPREEFKEADWQQLPEEEKPFVHTVDQEAMKKELRQLRKWKRFEETGEAPLSDTESEEEEEVVREDGALDHAYSGW